MSHTAADTEVLRLAIAELGRAAKLSADSRITSKLCTAVANIIASVQDPGRTELMDAATVFGFNVGYYASSIRVEWTD